MEKKPLNGYEQLVNSKKLREWSLMLQLLKCEVKFGLPYTSGVLFYQTNLQVKKEINNKNWVREIIFGVGIKLTKIIGLHQNALIHTKLTPTAWMLWLLFKVNEMIIHICKFDDTLKFEQYHKF